MPDSGKRSVVAVKTFLDSGKRLAMAPVVAISGHAADLSLVVVGQLACVMQLLLGNTLSSVAANLSRRQLLEPRELSTLW